jgi:hypothetical protein
MAGIKALILYPPGRVAQMTRPVARRDVDRHRSEMLRRRFVGKDLRVYRHERRPRSASLRGLVEDD